MFRSAAKTAFHRDDYRTDFGAVPTASLQRLHTVAASGRRYRQPAGATVINVTSWSTLDPVTGIAAKKGDSMRAVSTTRRSAMWIHWAVPSAHKRPAHRSSPRSPLRKRRDADADDHRFGFGPAPENLVTISVHVFVSRTTTLSYRAATAFHGTAAFCGANDCMRSGQHDELGAHADRDGRFGDMYGNDWIVNPHDAFCVGVWSSQSTAMERQVHLRLQAGGQNSADPPAPLPYCWLSMMTQITGGQDIHAWADAGLADAGPQIIDHARRFITVRARS